MAYSPLGRGFFAGKAVVESLPNESTLVFYYRNMTTHCTLTHNTCCFIFWCRYFLEPSDIPAVGYASAVFCRKYWEKQSYICSSFWLGLKACLHSTSTSSGMASPPGRGRNSNSWYCFKITIIVDFIRDRLHYKIDVQHHITCGSFNEDTSMM